MLFIGHPQRGAKHISNSSSSDYFNLDLLFPCNLYYSVIHTVFLCSLRELLQFSIYYFSKQVGLSHVLRLSICTLKHSFCMHVRLRIFIHMHTRHMKIPTGLCMLFWWIYAWKYAPVHFWVIWTPCIVCVRVLACVCIHVRACVFRCCSSHFYLCGAIGKKLRSKGGGRGVL